MHIQYKQSLRLFMLGILVCHSPVYAAKPAEHPLAAKLQAMVRQLTTERDGLKAETAKLAADNEQLKAQLSAIKLSADAAAAAEAKLQADLAAVQANNTRLQGQVETNQAKVHELTAIGKKLNQSKGDLEGQLEQLEQKQAFTASELEICDTKNISLLKASKDMVGEFNSQGFFSALLGKEPLIGFKGVDVESQIQAYQDKLASHRYLKQQPSPAVPENNGQPAAADKAQQGQ